MSRIVYPNYNNCILNTITSILKYYNVNNNHSSLPELDEKLSKKYKNVVLLILDGMGEHILNTVSHNGFFKNHELKCLTTVYPSTTTAALTTYYAGKPPYETGWIGWSQYFKEYGRALNMLSHTESYQNDSLKNIRLDVFKSVVNYTPIFEQIESASPDVKAYEITPSYSDKRSKRSLRADNLDDLFDSINLICNSNGNNFVLAYCDNPDALLHKYGCSSDEAKNMILDAEKRVEELKNKLGDDTIIIVSADHGHKDIEKVYDLLDYPELQECLIQPASIESRSVSFWVKEDKKKDFEKIFNNLFAEDFILMTKEEFLEKNMLGFGNKHKKIDDFIGNYFALSISSSIIKLQTYLNEGKKTKKSTHCGLTEDEMEVPLIVI